MPRPKFDVSEFTVVGAYPKAISFVIPGMPDMPPEPKLNKPITPKENFKLLLSGVQTPYSSLFDTKKDEITPQNSYF